MFNGEDHLRVHIFVPIMHEPGYLLPQNRLKNIIIQILLLFSSKASNAILGPRLHIYTVTKIRYKIVGGDKINIYT